MSCVLRVQPLYGEQTIPLLSIFGECPSQGLGDKLGKVLPRQGRAASGSLAVPMCTFVNGLKFARKSFMWLHYIWTVCIVLSS